MLRHRGRAALAAVLALTCGCASGQMGTVLGSAAPPAPVLWKFESVSWYNRYSMNSTVGPLVVGKAVLYGGTYGYQNTNASKLALLDPATGTARWRMDYGAAFGPLVLERGMIAVGAAAGGALLVPERETIRGLDIASGSQRWQATSSTDPIAAGDTAYFMDGQIL